MIAPIVYIHVYISPQPRPIIQADADTQTEEKEEEIVRGVKESTLAPPPLPDLNSSICLCTHHPNVCRMRMNMEEDVR